MHFYLLLATNVLLVTATSSFSMVSVLASQSVSQSVWTAGVPYSAYFMAMPASALLVAFASIRVGRKLTLLTAQVIGILAALICAYSLQIGSLALLIGGSALFGLFAGSTSSLRFYAAELTPPGTQMRAVGFVTGSGLVGAFCAPPLVSLGGIGAGQLPTSFHAIGIVLIVAFCLQLVVHQGARPTQTATRLQEAVPLILTDRRLLVVSIGAAIAWITMIAMMSTGPIAMLGCGLSSTNVVSAMQWHFVAMFSPPLLVPMIRHHTSPPVLFKLGLINLLFGCTAAIFDKTFLSFGLGLFFVGIGWGLIVVTTSTILATSLEDQSKRIAVQGLIDSGVFLCSGCGAVISGWIASGLGWEYLATGCGALIIMYWILLHRYINSISFSPSFIR
jgi:MFS family permease